MLRNDGANGSQHVIEGPSGSVANVSGRMDVLHGRMEEPEDAIQNNELNIAFIDLQKVSYVSWRLLCSEHASDVAVGVQVISLQSPVSTRANCSGKSSYWGYLLYCGSLLVGCGHCGRGFWTRVVETFIPFPLLLLS